MLVVWRWRMRIGVSPGRVIVSRCRGSVRSRVMMDVREWERNESVGHSVWEAGGGGVEEMDWGWWAFALVGFAWGCGAGCWCWCWGGRGAVGGPG